MKQMIYAFIKLLSINSIRSKKHLNEISASVLKETFRTSIIRFDLITEIKKVSPKHSVVLQKQFKRYAFKLINSHASNDSSKLPMTITTVVSIVIHTVKYKNGRF